MSIVILMIDEPALWYAYTITIKLKCVYLALGFVNTHLDGHICSFVLQRAKYNAWRVTNDKDNRLLGITFVSTFINDFICYLVSITDG